MKKIIVLFISIIFASTAVSAQCDAGVEVGDDQSVQKKSLKQDQSASSTKNAKVKTCTFHYVNLVNLQAQLEKMLKEENSVCEKGSLFIFERGPLLCDDSENTVTYESDPQIDDYAQDAPRIYFDLVSESMETTDNQLQEGDFALLRDTIKNKTGYVIIVERETPLQMIVINPDNVKELNGI